jgi:hypothetical protein
MSVWGSSASDVFAVGRADWNGQGDKSLILHYDGNQWTQMSTNTMSFLLGVWGSSASDVFAVGTNGTILHYDGDQWSEMSSGGEEYLFDVWGSSASDVFAVGRGDWTEHEEYESSMLHYDGNQWSEMTSGTDDEFQSVWGSSANDVFFVGVDNSMPEPQYGFIAHYDGSPNISVTIVVPGLMGVWGSSGSDVFAVGANGRIFHYNGSTWSEMSNTTTSNDLRSVWGSSGSDVFAVGGNGTILHYDGNQWSAMSSGVGEYLFDVWGSSASDVYAVGAGGTILYYYGGPLTAAFTADPHAGTAPLTVHFTDTSKGIINDWLWNFGDGSTGTTQNPNHTYNNPGTYDVSLTVTGPEGSDAETKAGYIRAAHIGADINNDGNVNLEDAVLALQVLTETEPLPIDYEQPDVNGDGKVGLEEAIYVLQWISGLR